MIELTIKCDNRDDLAAIAGFIGGGLQAMARDLGLENGGEGDSAPPAPSPDVIEPSVGDAFRVLSSIKAAPVMADPDPAPAITIHDIEDVFRRINSAEGLGINKSREILNSSGVKRVKEIPEAHWAVVLETALAALQEAGAK